MLRFGDLLCDRDKYAAAKQKCTDDGGNGHLHLKEVAISMMALTKMRLFRARLANSLGQRRDAHQHWNWKI